MMDTVNKVKVFEKVNQIHEDSNDGKLKVTIKKVRLYLLTSSIVKT